MPEGAAWDWLVEQSQARSRWSEADSDYLANAIGAIEAAHLLALSTSKQKTALMQIAVSAGRACRCSDVDDALKAKFIRAVPSLLSASNAVEALEAGRIFWDVFLAPDGLVPGVSAPVAEAIVTALTEQLADPEPELRWSAAEGVALLPVAVAMELRQANPALFSDPDIRALAFPRRKGRG